MAETVVVTTDDLEPAAWRMRFSWTKDWASARPPSGGPNIALSGTQMSVNETRGWSVGML